MYSSIFELPTQVTSSLDERDAELWMNAYNQATGGEAPQDKDAIRAARRQAWEAVKNNPSSFSFCIKASMEDIDKDGEIIDVDSIKEHMDSFIDYGGNVQTEHGNYNTACIWGWDPYEENGMKGLIVWGNVFGGDQVYDEARRNFVEGRNSLSVAGEATMGRYQCDEKGCYVRRTVKQLMEISLCDVPANKHATMLWYNDHAKMTKSASVQGPYLNVNEYTIHKDYTACNIQKLKKAMFDRGFTDVHGRADGVFVKMSPREYDWQKPAFEAKGLVTIPMEGGILVNTRNELIKHTYKNCLMNGYIDRSGVLTKSVPREVFTDLHNKGMLEEICGIYMVPIPSYE